MEEKIWWTFDFSILNLKQKELISAKMETAFLFTRNMFRKKYTICLSFTEISPVKRTLDIEYLTHTYIHVHIRNFWKNYRTKDRFLLYSNTLFFFFQFLTNKISINSSLHYLLYLPVVEYFIYHIKAKCL